MKLLSDAFPQKGEFFSDYSDYEFIDDTLFVGCKRLQQQHTWYANIMGVPGCTLLQQLAEVFESGFDFVQGGNLLS